MNEVHFQTPNVVWDGVIAIYLFLLGIASGATLLAVWFKRKHKLTNPSQNWLIRSAAVLAPSSIIIGLTLLIFHLARPWTFWYLMFNYQFGSVMSMGVMLFQVMMAVLFLWLAIIFKNEIGSFSFVPKFVVKLIEFAEKFVGLIEILLMILALLLGVYTGFLISDLISYPMLNNPVLPYLFLASGTSSGIAAVLVAVLVVGKLSTHSDEVHFLHKWEAPVALAELALLAIFFGYLYSQGGQSAVAADFALFDGFWGTLFWGGVVGLGLLFPQIANLIVSKETKYGKGFMLLLATSVLIGVLCLRYFILYAGQMTIAGL